MKASRKLILFSRFTLIVLILLLALSNELNAQSCSGYDKKCASAPKEFKASSLSRSISLRKMRKVVINQVLYGDRTYQISVCGKNRLGKIQFRLISDDEQRTVLYDNAVDNFKQVKLFEINSTMKVVIEITAPHFFEDGISECAGVKIYYKTGA